MSPGTGLSSEIEFNDNAFPGAEWYVIELDSRLQVEAFALPKGRPRTISLSDAGTIEVVLPGTLRWQGSGAIAEPGSLDPRSLKLGDQHCVDTPIALGQAGQPLYRVADVSGDGEVDFIGEFSIPELVANGDLQLGWHELWLSGASTSQWRSVWVGGFGVLVVP